MVFKLCIKFLIFGILAIYNFAILIFCKSRNIQTFAQKSHYGAKTFIFLQNLLCELLQTQYNKTGNSKFNSIGLSLPRGFVKIRVAIHLLDFAKNVFFWHFIAIDCHEY